MKEDWANIPADILRRIADLLTYSIEERVRASAVCKSWQAVIDTKLNRNIKSPVCLMLSETEKSDKLCLYNVTEETLVELNLPEIRMKVCWGTPFGWLVTCSPDIDIELFHPLSRATLPLPSLHSFTHRHAIRDPDDTDSDTEEDTEEEEEEEASEYILCKPFVHKLILSSSPAVANSDCIVLAIITEYRLLAFAKPGDKAWKPIETLPFETKHGRRLDDAIYFKGNFYTCVYTGEIFICEDLDGSHPKAVSFAPPPPLRLLAKKYLFDLGGNLCLASRTLAEHSEKYDYEVYNTDDDDETKAEILRFSSFEFAMFMLDMDTRSWERIYSLGDKSLFLGNCTTFVVAAADHPGCKPNCIYFADDSNLWHVHDSTKGRSIDMGIFDCQNSEFDLYDVEIDYDKLVEPFPKLKDVPSLFPSSLSRPLWIIPCSR